MTLQELLDMPPEEFRALAEAAVQSTRIEGGLHRVKGMTDFLCAVHQLQRMGWKRAPRSEVMRVTGHSDRTNRLYATWQRRSGTIGRMGSGFKHKPMLPPTACRSYSLEPNKFFQLYKAPSTGVAPNDVSQPTHDRRENPPKECAVPVEGAE